MQRSRWRSLTVLVCAAAVWLSHAPAATAESGKRIAVLEVEGARNGKLRRALTKLIEEQHRVIGPDAYRRAARRLKAKKLNPDDVAKVAAKVKADAVLHGMLVAEDDESYMFRLRLRDGASGRTVKRLAVRLSEPSLSGKLQYKLGVRLLDAIDDLQAADDEEAIAAVEDVDARPARKKSRSRAIAIREASEDDADEDITEESVSLADDEEASDRGARDSRRDADDEAIRSAEEEPLDDMEPPSEQRVAALADEDEDVDSGSDAKGSSLRATVTRSEPVRVNSAMVQVQAGVSVVQRSLAFTTRQGLENQPAGYSGPPAAGAFASGEMYPLAGGEGLAANVGGAFMIDRVIGLKTLIPGPDGQPLGPPSTTNMQRWSVGVRVRKSFGEHAHRTIGEGWSRLRQDRSSPSTTPWACRSICPTARIRWWLQGSRCGFRCRRSWLSPPPPAASSLPKPGKSPRQSSTARRRSPVVTARPASTTWRPSVCWYRSGHAARRSGSALAATAR